MKKFAYTLIVALFVTSLATPWYASAHQSVPSASGVYSFVPDDGFTKQIQFSATKDERGVTTGEVTIRDEARIAEPDPKGGEDPGEVPASEFFVTARLDSLTIEHNRAVMGGTVTDSSHPSYIGKFIQVVVEDNGDGREEPDKVSWCYCQPEPGGWVPSDYEDPLDQGAYLTWWATDAELRDDAGIPSENIIPGNQTSCPTFPIATYEFGEVRSGEGNIEVLP
jgi:hypothetical protein